jgi:prepilin-type N-terminal cleavage/methylation domain-containing protein/prepilin-type processing-associated H-X9-DG protein
MSINRPRLRSQRAFTLVELLVVIAIIGVLVSLLLPAVQAAREAARRSQCANNLKQFGLAIHNFHDVNLRLPPAGGNDQSTEFGTAGTGGRWGSSWLVYILPHMEQGQIYEKFRFTGNGGGSGWGNGATTADATNNVIVARNISISSFHCPSSPLSKWCRGPHTGRREIMAPSYVAIAGGARNLIPTSVYNETRVNNGGTASNCCSGGQHSASGAIVAAGKHSLASLTDGTSNVWMVSENANWVFTANNSRQDYRSCAQHGWIIGWRANCTPPSCGNNNDQRTFNFTTVRYPINHFSQRIHGLPNHPGNCATHGICENSSTNYPLSSAHPGGVMVLLADGSVRFTSQTIKLDVMGRFVHRDDKLPVSE